MAIAAKNDNPNKKHVAVIGDGAMTAGMAFEALSHAGHLNPNILVILNDNDMSISENIGGLSNYFSRIWASKTYKGIKKGGR
jgi:1-deoxy-D-xylulose-5-phosphate synthase